MGIFHKVLLYYYFRQTETYNIRSLDENYSTDSYVPGSFTELQCCWGRYCFSSALLSSPTSPWPEFSLSVGGEASTARTNILWSFAVVLSSPAAPLVGISLRLLGSTRKVVAVILKKTAE